jgi:hypothetical protein
MSLLAKTRLPTILSFLALFLILKPALRTLLVPLWGVMALIWDRARSRFLDALVLGKTLLTAPRSYFVIIDPSYRHLTSTELSINFILRFPPSYQPQQELKDFTPLRVV